MSRKPVALVGFVILGLAPSYEDFKQSPEDRVMMAGFYIVAILLIYFGLLSD